MDDAIMRFGRMIAGTVRGQWRAFQDVVRSWTGDNVPKAETIGLDSEFGGGETEKRWKWHVSGCFVHSVCKIAG